MLVQYFCMHVLTFGVLASGLSIIYPGPKYVPTNGEVWPKPQHEIKNNMYYTFNSSDFKITITNYSCKILYDSVERYINTLKKYESLRSRAEKSSFNNKHKNSDEQYKGHILYLKVVLTAPCEVYPSFDMNEKYSLEMSRVSVLESESIWGVLRGLKTFVQLFYLHEGSNEIRINSTSIVDFPSYPHRGLLLDTARHYISVGNILKTLNAMAINKMNVFHWHIVDDQSFPYQSEKFPELSMKGAFHSSMVYTKRDINRIVQYARFRGIRVIPEFDIPGHTRSWGIAYPYLLTQCYSSDGKLVGLGPLDPLSNVTLDVLKDLIAEVLDCWKSNLKLQEYIHRHGVTAADLHALFMRNVIPLLNNNTSPIVWQEVFDENVPLPKDTIIQVWKYNSTLEMIRALKAGYKVLFSSDWYLSGLSSEWPAFYKSDPRQMVYNVINNDTLLDSIVGGEACMWGEMVDDRNVISRVWPRASAIAETLWHSKSLSEGLYEGSAMAAAETFHRLEEHTCRMIHRGVDAQPPSGPGFCFA